MEESVVEIFTKDNNNNTRKEITKAKKKGTIFHDLHQVIDIPIFVDFVNSYFSKWSTTEVVIQLCRMYIDLDKFSSSILDPFEKIEFLKDVILSKYDRLNEQNDSQVVSIKPSKCLYSIVENSNIMKDLEKLTETKSSNTNPYETIFIDVANIMEYDVTRKFIEKYFLNWDIGDFVTVLIKMYKSMDRFPNLSQMEKFGILQQLLQDQETRRIIASTVSSWKSGIITSIRYNS
jgi:hypothetical protein